LWGCFEITGNIEAYLLYKDIEALTAKDQTSISEEEEKEEN
jgi:hypothetical protein